MADICEKVGADVQDVARAIGLLEKEQVPTLVHDAQGHLDIALLGFGFGG